MTTIGILGGGQLGRMLALAAAKLGHRVIVLDPDPNAPAAQVSNRHIVAAYDDPAALDQLAKACDVVTYEFENVPDAAVHALEGRVPVHPNAHALGTAQDRLVEKTFLVEQGIATAPFRAVDSQVQLDTAVGELGGRVILKTRRFGYDGKGQRRIDPGDGTGPGSLNAFTELGSVPLIAEGVVDFVAEASVIIGRSLSGEVRCFDPVRNRHHDGILRTSSVPAGLDPATDQAARAAAVDLVTALDYVGVLGLELFVLDDGSVLANEFAPRVHNSGHWTEAACIVSQFELHVRAITGLPLPSVERHSDAEMTNLVGDDVERLPTYLAEPNTMVHLYGKSEVRAGRKMGHVTQISPRAPIVPRTTQTGGVLRDLTLDLPGHRAGKVRETWQLPNQRRLLVTTDRLSAFDRIIGLVPNKGQVLNQLAAWWFEQTADIVANHMVSMPDPNALIAIDAAPLPVEVVVRARLTGSTSTAVLPRYLAGERVLYGHTLPDGLTPHGPLPAPIVTPTTKAPDGDHDQPITVTEVVELGLIEPELWQRIQQVALDLFARGSAIADAAGFVLADTKYEFGIGPDGELLLIDEMHTPDSSRYWSQSTLDDRLAAGEAPDGYDKEPVRLALVAAGYRGDGPPPELSPEVWEQTSARYVELYERLTGQTFVPASQPAAERITANLSEFSSHE